MAIELKKHPETEAEYWAAIEGLGGHIFWTNHELNRGHIDPSEEILKSIENSQQLMTALTQEISDNYGIILPKDYPQVKSSQELPPPPEGKKYYWDWYKEQKRQFLEKEYDDLICSACPLSEGLERFISLGGDTIPCKPFPGSLYKLSAPYRCAMIDMGRNSDWTKEQLQNYILASGGKKALARFEAKETLLREKNSTSQI